MGWAKFDDQFSDHPKVVAAGPMAELLAMRAVIHCARYETDGHVQAAQLPRLALGVTSPKKQVAKLVEVGLWVEDEGGDGWWVHDFLDYHPSRADKDEEREKARERMAKARANKSKRSSGSSEDVQANTQTNNGRSSGNPDPARTPPQVPDGTLDHPRPEPPAEPAVSDDARALTRLLAQRVKANGFKIPSPGQKAHRQWLVDADRMIRLDEVDPDEARQVCEWATSDEFWMTNIQSMPKFREKYAQLRLKWLNTSKPATKQDPVAARYGAGAR